MRLERIFYKNRVVIHKQIIEYSTKELLPYSLKDFVYKDQSWLHVQYLRDIFFAKSLNLSYDIADNTCVNTKVKNIDATSAVAKSNKETDNWVYWYLDENLPENYVISFDSTVNSLLTEFQLAFRHTSIADRIRFQVVDNKFISFDIVRGGFFFSELRKSPFSFDLHKKYNIKLVVLGNIYSFVVDDQPILTVKDKTSTRKEGGFVFVFWDKHGEHEMNIGITNFKIQTVVSNV